MVASPPRPLRNLRALRAKALLLRLRREARGMIPPNRGLLSRRPAKSAQTTSGQLGRIAWGTCETRHRAAHPVRAAALIGPRPDHPPEILDRHVNSSKSSAAAYLSLLWNLKRRPSTQVARPECQKPTCVPLAAVASSSLLRVRRWMRRFSSAGRASRVLP